MCNDTRHPVRLSRSPYWAFITFGAFWGTWGASVPRLRELAQVSDAELGLALLFIGVGALPAMLLAGRALDRWGLWLAGPLIFALGASGVGVALTAGGGMAALCAGMTVVGVASGAADVAMNSLAGRAEQVTESPVIARAHATLSAVAVAAILATGGFTGIGAPLVVPFAITSIVATIACVSIVLALRRYAPPSGAFRGTTPGMATAPGRSFSLLIALGVLGALAFAAENAHQSWSALFLEEEVSAPPGVSSLGPAVFAGVVAITRFSMARIPSRHVRTILLVGTATATCGAISLASAPTLGWALASLVLAAAGTAVLFPTIMGIVSRSVPEHRRARATSLVTTIAYLGFLAGPAYVGLVTDAAGLRGALMAVALLTAIMLPLIPAAVRRSRIKRTLHVS